MTPLRNHAPRCPICDSGSSIAILHAARQPSMLNRLYTTTAEALVAKAVDVEFRACNRCGFAWNANFDSAAIDYSPGYNNDQSQSMAFRQHLSSVEELLGALITQQPGAILEVGCGKGDFLRALTRRTGRVGLGFDPAGDEVVSETGVIIEPRVFDSTAADAVGHDHTLAVVCIRHVLEHLPNPKHMLALIAHALRRSPRAHVYLEVPCFEWIAQHAAFFDLFHEHCSLFTPGSLRMALRTCGFGDVRISRCFGGQYLSATARVGQFAADDRELKRVVVDHRVAQEHLEVAKQAAADFFRDASPADRTVLWGCGAKGVSLVNHLRLDLRNVMCIVDVNPAKQGKFVPITAHPVVAPASMCNLGRHNCDAITIVVMNSNYTDEIAADLRARDVHARIVVLEDALPHALPG